MPPIAPELRAYSPATRFQRGEVQKAPGHRRKPQPQREGLALDLAAKALRVICGRIQHFKKECHARIWLNL